MEHTGVVAQMFRPICQTVFVCWLHTDFFTRTTGRCMMEKIGPCGSTACFWQGMENIRCSLTLRKPTPNGCTRTTDHRSGRDWLAITPQDQTEGWLSGVETARTRNPSFQAYDRLG